MFSALLIVLFVYGVRPIQAAASNTLANCNTLATQFSATCGGTVLPNITLASGTSVSCTSGFTSSTCPGTFSGGTCTFVHKLCVTCSGSSPVRVRVQTNGLPRHCPNAPGAIRALEIDFEVNFNPDVSVNSPNHNPTSVSALSSIVCSITNQASAPSGSNFVARTSANMMVLAGVSIDGVTILNVNSANNVDPFFPAGSYSAEQVDACLGHPSPSDNAYHYHAGTGCALNPPSGNITSCTANTACNTNVATYSISTFSSYQTLTVIGIAKDGHIIYGPYTASGTQVTSGFDICNGMFHDSTGNYGYFITRTYPYITGCFGPGNYPSFSPNCTTNGPGNYTKSSFALAQTIVTTTTTATTATTTTATTATTATTVATTRSAAGRIPVDSMVAILIITSIGILF